MQMIDDTAQSSCNVLALQVNLSACSRSEFSSLLALDSLFGQFLSKPEYFICSGSPVPKVIAADVRWKDLWQAAAPCCLYNMP